MPDTCQPKFILLVLLTRSPGLKPCNITWLLTASTTTRSRHRGRNIALQNNCNIFVCVIILCSRSLLLFKISKNEYTVHSSQLVQLKNTLLKSKDNIRKYSSFTSSYLIFQSPFLVNVYFFIESKNYSSATTYAINFTFPSEFVLYTYLPRNLTTNY